MDSCKRGVLFPVDLNNYQQNLFSVAGLFRQLQQASTSLDFVAYHHRRSGNFLFRIDEERSLVEAQRVGEQVIGLRCLIRSLADLEEVNKAIPQSANTTPGGSVVLQSPSGGRKLIFVALSDSVPTQNQVVGRLNSRCMFLSWPSDRDVLCLYDRPSRGGDVGQVTTAVLTALHKSLGCEDLYATGRAFSVIRDLLTPKGLRYN